MSQYINDFINYVHLKLYANNNVNANFKLANVEKKLIVLNETNKVMILAGPSEPTSSQTSSQTSAQPSSYYNLYGSSANCKRLIFCSQPNPNSDPNNQKKIRSIRSIRSVQIIQ